MKNITENKIEKLIKKILPQAGEILRKKFRKTGVKYTKSHALDVVTEADIAVNRMLLNTIRKNFPDHGIVSEETGKHQNNSEYIWVIDPLDGTLNFSRGIPFFVSMLAVFRNKKLIMSAIYDPIYDELAFARHGFGAMINGKRIKASRCKDVRTSIGTVSSVFQEEQKKLFNLLVKEAEKLKAMATGSEGYNAMITARGAGDWYVNYNPRIWDIAPGVLLLKEAGHKVTNIYGKSWQFGDRGIISAEKNLHKKLVGLVRKSLDSP